MIILTTLRTMSIALAVLAVLVPRVPLSPCSLLTVCYALFTFLPIVAYLEQMRSKPVNLLIFFKSLSNRSTLVFMRCLVTVAVEVVEAAVGEVGVVADVVEVSPVPIPRRWEATAAGEFPRLLI